MILAGTVADADWISYLYGPRAFLQWHRTYFDSLLVAAALSLSLAVLVFFAAKARGHASPMFAALAGPVFAALFHVLLDACQSDGAMPFWPFRHGLVRLDWLPRFDPWIFFILLAAILLPELFLLVSREIGAAAKRPRGRPGALIGLSFLLFYGGARAILHARAVAKLQNQTYETELPRHLAAFPSSISLFTWHGIVETASAIRLLDVNLSPGAYFNPQGAFNIYKPEPSRILKAAQDTDAAQEFLKYARFPKATVEKETTGYLVEIHDLRYLASGTMLGAIQVEINLDLAGNVTFAHLEWENPTQH
jgi:membrane-bound metal-dependent hydrolase YbcI (DUF457 family)